MKYLRRQNYIKSILVCVCVFIPLKHKNVYFLFMNVCIDRVLSYPISRYRTVAGRALDKSTIDLGVSYRSLRPSTKKSLPRFNSCLRTDNVVAKKRTMLVEK